MKLDDKKRCLATVSATKSCGEYFQVARKKELFWASVGVAAALGDEILPNERTATSACSIPLA